MKVTFLQTGCFEVVRDGILKDCYESLDAAAEYIAEHFPEGEGEVWEILDLKNGAIVMRFEDEENFYKEENWEDWEERDDEIGYNPYMGCFDFDC